MSEQQVLFRYRYAEPVPRRAEAGTRGLTLQELAHAKLDFGVSARSERK